MRPKALLILGMHRSGTSALTRVLNLCGLPLGRDFVAPSSDNPKGFWEHRQVVDIHEQLLKELGHEWASISPMPANWRYHPATATARARLRQLVDVEFASDMVWGIKDPRLCRLVPMWIDLLSDMGVDPRFLFVVRDPNEVTDSMWKRDRRLPSVGELLWIQHIVEPERATRGYMRAMVAYDELLNDWHSIVARLEDELDIRLPVSDASVNKVIDFLDSGLRHHRYSPPESPRQSFASTLYGACLDAKDHRQGWGRIAEIGGSYEQGIAMFGSCISELSEFVQCSEKVALTVGTFGRGVDAAAYLRGLQVSLLSAQEEAKTVWKEKEWFREQVEVTRKKAVEQETILNAEQAKVRFAEEDGKRLHEQIKRLQHEKLELEGALAIGRTTLQSAQEECRRLYNQVERLSDQRLKLERSLAAELASSQSVKEESRRLRDQVKSLQLDKLKLEKSLAADEARVETLYREHQVQLQHFEVVRGELSYLREIHEMTKAFYQKARNQPLSLKERLTGRREEVAVVATATGKGRSDSGSDA